MTRMYNFIFVFAALFTEPYLSTQSYVHGDNLCTVLCSGTDDEQKSILQSHFTRNQADVEFIKENLRNSSLELAQIRAYLHDLTIDGKELRFTRAGVSSIPRHRLSLQKTEQELENGVPEIVSKGPDVDTEQASNVIKTVPSDCEEIRKQLGQYYIGRYYTQINPSKDSISPPFIAGCELREDTGWTIIHKRIDGSLSFDRSWEEYKNGFGNVEGEFWLGNDNIHRLTRQNTYRLRIELQTGSGRKFFAEYSNFRIADESDNYRLIVSGYLGGSAGDALTGILSHNGSLFTTRDRDNDKYEAGNCAIQYHGGWWFHSCFVAFLNGIVPSGTQPVQTGYTTRDATSWHARKVRSFYVPAMMQDGIVWRTINKRQTRDSSYYDDVVIKMAMMMIAPR